MKFIGLSQNTAQWRPPLLMTPLVSWQARIPSAKLALYPSVTQKITKCCWKLWIYVNKNRNFNELFYTHNVHFVLQWYAASFETPHITQMTVFCVLKPCRMRYSDISEKFLFNNQPDALIIQIYSVIKLYMFRESSLPIIRSFLLYIRHW